jgi:hypothetical protein
VERIGRSDRPSQDTSETQESCCRKSKTRISITHLGNRSRLCYLNSPPATTRPLPQAPRLLPVLFQ